MMYRVYDPSGNLVFTDTDSEVADFFVEIGPENARGYEVVPV